MTRASLTGAAAALALISRTTGASATIVTAGSAPFTITNVVSSAITGGASDLLASVTLSNFKFENNGTDFSVKLVIANDTDEALSPDGLLTAFGFNTNVDATGIKDNTGKFYSYLNASFPGLGLIDVCLSTGPDCTAGNKLAPGKKDVFTLTLMGLPSGTNSIDIGPGAFSFTWQAPMMVKSACTAGSGCVSAVVLVPEPASVLLLGAGLLGLGMAARRKLG